MPRDPNEKCITLVTWSYNCPCGEVHNCTYASDEWTAELNGRMFARMCADAVGHKNVRITRVVRSSGDVDDDKDWLDEVPF